MQVTYDTEHWGILKELRRISISVLDKLQEGSMKGYVYGSVARGDVKSTSDVDVIVFSPNLVWLDLMEADHKFIVQATPGSTPKAYIALDPEERTVISFPLGKLTGVEEDFYRFGGLIDKEALLRDERVPGVNKQLQLIIPTREGHDEIPLRGNEDLAVRLTKVSMATVLQREKLLTRRKERGKTGTFLTYELRSDESIQQAVRDLFKENKFFRRNIDRGRDKR
ncbi:nucleotidyltransferase domain-containing protein [Metallosphaera hakonensis]|uniref:DNA polymerase subunit beta n=1 Tax=Metallosphaera hakonensis JCM 8857 = DSM 7519 TaxID=1293036 RepID=A0A2U9IUC1_9CREN|nr:nucleotidyltransferase domain-containing protein [Metallosphaera hakonensis]AWR99583.1 DNA polymerase subunit beta [Metallosphaera hakonensis JCM 8857 = DSM 7519]